MNQTRNVAGLAVEPFDTPKTYIRKLAVAYDAFSEALRNDDERGMRVWAWSLLDAQERTGVELYRNEWLRKLGSYNDETEKVA